MRRQARLAWRGVEASRSHAQTNVSWRGRCFGNAYAFRLEKRSRLGTGWQMREHMSFQTMTRAKYHAADILLRLLKSRQRPAAGQGSANLHEHVPIPAKQREVRFSDFESVARLKERGGLRER